MKKVSLAIFLIFFSLLSTISLADSHHLSKVFINPGDSFEWEISTDYNVSFLQVSVPEGITLDEKTFSSNKKVTIKFDTSTGLEQGVYILSAHVKFQGPPTDLTYLTAVVVGMATDEDVKDVEDDVDDLKDRTTKLEIRVGDLEKGRDSYKKSINEKIDKLNEEISDLKENLTNQTGNVEELRARIQALQFKINDISKDLNETNSAIKQYKAATNTGMAIVSTGLGIILVFLFILVVLYRGEQFRKLGSLIKEKLLKKKPWQH